MGHDAVQADASRLDAKLQVHSQVFAGAMTRPRGAVGEVLPANRRACPPPSPCPSTLGEAPKPPPKVVAIDDHVRVMRPIGDDSPPSS
jgi:hypothetical protein